MESLHYLLMAAYSTVNRAILAEAAKLGLTPGQPKILEFLTRHGESDQKTLAADCEIEPATAGGILFRMEEAGLVARHRSDGDRRAVLVSLTPKGRSAAEKMLEAFAAVDERAASLLSEEDEKKFKESLAAVRRAMARGRNSNDVSNS